MPRKRKPVAEAVKLKKAAQKRVKKTAAPKVDDEVVEHMTLDVHEPAPGQPLTKAQLAVRGINRKAREARSDLSKFYGFVIKHETTKQALKVAPHQEVTFAFMQEYLHCVIRQPIGTGKTFGSAALGLWLTGQDQTQRGSIVSKTQGQGAKVLRMMADYIEEPSLNAALTLVFPWLKKSTRPGDAWTQTELTVERPAGIRDSSVLAVGLDGAIGGARLSWLLGDDILDADNTMTTASRDQVHSRFDSRVLSRLDPTGSRAVITNTPWNREDLTFQLEKSGWPTLVMDIYGYIKFTNVDEAWILSTGLLRPSSKREGWWRLAKHDPDPDELVPLWPERYSSQAIADLRRMRLPHEFARLFLCQPFDEGSTRCLRQWIEEGKNLGRGQWSGGPVSFNSGNPIYTGVDIAVGTKERNDETSMVTFEMLADKKRRLIDVESGRWSGPDITSRLIEKHDKFGSVVSVENNAAQDFIRQFAQAKRPDLRVRAHTTGSANKHHIDFGVESIFTEMKQGAWVFPCDAKGNCPPEFEKLFEECMFYQPPPAHTGDRLMGLWIARESSRRGGGGRDPKPTCGLKMEFASGGGF